MGNHAVVPAVAGIALTAGLASAGLVFETEPNDTIANANFAGLFDDPGGSVAIDGNIDGGDVDWFEITLTQMATLFVSAIGSTDPDADSQLMVVDASGTDVIAFDDDSGPGFLSAIQLVDLGAGTYYIGVSAFADLRTLDDPVGNDLLFNGIDEADGSPTDAEFDYKLVIGVNVIPTPATLALLGLGGVAAVRRRR